MYRYLKVREVEDVHYRSSLARHAVLDSKLENIRTEGDVRYWLGDEEEDLPIFRTEDKQQDVLLTLATGLNYQSSHCVLYYEHCRNI